ncbi:MAG TPA: ComEC/Rec2 family competence protein [Flavipsychrobacter sp.]|nr:ComEC/Rec2 family competence protein [Flavipsychrobacter sp.]
MSQWKSAPAHFWKEAPFFRLLLPLVAGIFWYDLHHQTASAFILLMTFLFILLFVFIKKNSGIYNSCKTILLHAALVLTGYTSASLADIRNHPHWFGHHVNDARAYMVRITEEPQEKERTWKLPVVVEEKIGHDLMVQKAEGKAFIYIYKNDSKLSFDRSDRLIIPATWQPLRNPGNPHEFDYADFCKRNNIFYQQFLSSDAIATIENVEASSLSYADRVHDWAMEQLAFYVKNDRALGLLQAMLLGDETNFKDEDRQLYVDTGIIHIVAISGGHIAFLMVLITGALFWIRKKKDQWIKPAVALPVVIFYVMVAGAPPSAVRAAVVFSILAFSGFAQRDNNPLNTLLATAFAILLVVPMWLFSVGFQLSFAAVLSLVLFYKRIYALYVPSNKILKFLWSAIAASLAAEILVAPLVVYYFHLLPASFLIANVVAVLLMTVIMSLGLAIILFSGIHAVASALSAIIAGTVHVFNAIISHVRLLNPESLRFLHLTLTELVLCYLLITATTVFILQKSKPALYGMLAGFSLLLISFNIRHREVMRREQLTVYNISRHVYVDYISGDYFTVISESRDSIAQKKIDYAVKENHIVNGAWKQRKKVTQKSIFLFGKKKIALLKSPVTIDTTSFYSLDIVIVEYPVRNFNALQLQKMLGFRKLIITGDQRRKAIQDWKDSCLKYDLDVHFTMLDGAAIVTPD